MKTVADDTRHLSRPSVLGAARFGLAVGCMYALLASVVVALRGGTPESWGDAGLISIVVAEVGGGLVGGTLFGLLAGAARYWVGALLVTGVGLSPMIVGVLMLVEGPSSRTVVAGLGASFLIGSIVGHQLWRLDSRHW